MLQPSSKIQQALEQASASADEADQDTQQKNRVGDDREAHRLHPLAGHGKDLRLSFATSATGIPDRTRSCNCGVNTAGFYPIMTKGKKFHWRNYRTTRADVIKHFTVIYTSRSERS